jgi:molybdopterin/thiamine biosynthesis adenylyltransferase
MEPLTLHLTLFRQYFDAILAGTKNIEYRRRSDRYDKQFQKPFTHIKFVNGYGNHRPWLLIKIERFEKTSDQWLIHLGNILEHGNI